LWGGSRVEVGSLAGRVMGILARVVKGSRLGGTTAETLRVVERRPMQHQALIAGEGRYSQVNSQASTWMRQLYSVKKAMLRHTDAAEISMPSQTGRLIEVVAKGLISQQAQ
jgi:hypothetical protein